MKLTLTQVSIRPRLKLERDIKSIEQTGLRQGIHISVRARCRPPIIFRSKAGIQAFKSSVALVRLLIGKTEMQHHSITAQTMLYRLNMVLSLKHAMTVKYTMDSSRSPSATTSKIGQKTSSAEATSSWCKTRRTQAQRCQVASHRLFRQELVQVEAAMQASNCQLSKLQNLRVANAPIYLKRWRCKTASLCGLP